MRWCHSFNKNIVIFVNGPWQMCLFLIKCKLSKCHRHSKFPIPIWQCHPHQLLSDIINLAHLNTALLQGQVGHIYLTFGLYYNAISLH